MPVEIVIYYTSHPYPTKMASRIVLASPPTTAPDCRQCGGPSFLLKTRSSNRNGNAGRPYYKCLLCNKFLVFNDVRGNNVRNPPCHFGASSKMQISGAHKNVPRGLHFVCRLGKCDFYQAVTDDNQRQISLREDSLVNLFKSTLVI